MRHASFCQANWKILFRRLGRNGEWVSHVASAALKSGLNGKISGHSQWAVAYSALTGVTLKALAVWRETVLQTATALTGLISSLAGFYYNTIWFQITLHCWEMNESDRIHTVFELFICSFHVLSIHDCFRFVGLNINTHHSICDGVCVHSHLRVNVH